MWSTSNPLTPTSDEYDSPKVGVLPAFQRLSAHYPSTGRPNHYYTQVSNVARAIFFFLFEILVI